MSTLTLWHGGRNLEHSYKEFKSATKKRWEHGPGLYLTTHYDTASSYAKGGGKTYLVEFSEGNNIDNIIIDLPKVYEFVNSTVIGHKRKEVLDCIHDNSNRTSDGTKIKASYLLNIMINFDAIVATKTDKLNNFLVEHGADYSIVDRFKGRNETVFVIFNNKLINKVKVISAKDVNLSQWELDVQEFLEIKKIIKKQLK